PLPPSTAPATDMCVACLESLSFTSQVKSRGIRQEAAYSPYTRCARQVIQHAMHRPQSMAAQYLHQMYAAQQQHFMLQTAALQQHQHPAHLQSLAAIQQVSLESKTCSHCFSGFSLSEVTFFFNGQFGSGCWCFPKLSKRLSVFSL
uniref:Uncharacterized protein n=1 Tax=Oreochromis aureus TaxID=47969 RepID=A0A668SNS2_OREAU